MKIKSLTGATAAVLLVFGTVNVSAAIISAPQTINDSLTVELSNLEWLSWDVTAGYSRAEIENGALGLLDQGWRFSTRNEFESLFDSLWGGVEGASALNYPGALWLYSNLDLAGPVSEDGDGGFIASQAIFYGENAECGSVDFSCYGYYQLQSVTNGTSSGSFRDRFGLSNGVDEVNDFYTISDTYVRDGEFAKAVSSALVRDQTIAPAPN
jgi:hypothetical protein